MITSDAIREVMKEKGISLSVLAGRLGLGKSTMSERLRQKNISVGKANEVLRVMDYKIIIVPSDTRIPDGGYEVE